MSIWKTPDQKPDINKQICVKNKFNCIIYFGTSATAAPGKEWAYVDDLIDAADRVERMQVELDETKKALLRDFEIRNECLTKILESYLNFAGLVRAYPNVPALPTFRAGNIIYDWSPVLEFMKNGRTDRALERLKAIEPDQICPKCGEKMTETMLLSLPPKTQYKCWKCGCAETKGTNDE